MHACGHDLHTAALCGAALLLIPESSEKRAVKLVCGLVLTLLLLKPLRSPDIGRFAEILNTPRLGESGLAEKTDALSLDLCRELIRSGTEEYIWDAAQRLGISHLGIRLGMRDGEELPYPWTIELTGEYTSLQKEQLSLLLEGDLGIARERQVRSTDDAG